MTAYKRYFLPGGTYFFTVNLLERKRRLLTKNIEILRLAFTTTKQEQPFTIDAIVILPDHLHTIWRLPDGDSDFSNRWKKIKGNFSKALPNEERIAKSRQSKGKRGI